MRVYHIDHPPLTFRDNHPKRYSLPFDWNNAPQTCHTQTLNNLAITMPDPGQRKRRGHLYLVELDRIDYGHQPVSSSALSWRSTSEIRTKYLARAIWLAVQQPGKTAAASLVTESAWLWRDKERGNHGFVEHQLIARALAHVPEVALVDFLHLPGWLAPP